MTLIDGRQLASSLNERTKAAVNTVGRSVELSVIACNPSPETWRYLALKEKTALLVGVTVNKTILAESADTQTVCEVLAQASSADGVLVQLPLPSHIDTNLVLASVPPAQDIDALNPKTTLVFSPVVAAMIEIIQAYEIPVFGRHVVVVGSGRLVGQPAARWFMEQGAAVSIVTKDTVDIPYYTKQADILVLGAGVPGLITPDLVKPGVVVLDAGTSEDGGVLRGDADPTVATVASIFTPVPGGIGPLTVAALFSNLLTLAVKRTKV